MRDTFGVTAWTGGAMLICVSLMVLCQHAEGERTRAALQVEQAQVDGRIRTLDARLTDIQADANRKKLATVVNPPMDPKRLARASKELDQLIAKAPSPAASASGIPTFRMEEGQDEAGTSGVKGVPPRGSSATTADPGAGELVRVCAGGHYYHRPGCKRVRKQTTSLTCADAEARGWKPCPTCKP